MTTDKKTPAPRARRRKTRLAEVAGWYGMLAILTAYGLASFDIISVNSWIYQLLNLSGALMLIWISFRKHVTQVVALNTVWALVALLALGQLFLR